LLPCSQNNDVDADGILNVDDPCVFGTNATELTDNGCTPDGVLCTIEYCEDSTVVDGAVTVVGRGCVSVPQDSACAAASAWDDAVCASETCEPDAANADGDGCVRAYNHSYCSDGDVCTAETCSPANATRVVSGCVFVSVDPADPYDCTDDVCVSLNGLGPENTPNHDNCDDGNACTMDTCIPHESMVSCRLIVCALTLCVVDPKCDSDLSCSFRYSYCSLISYVFAYSTYSIFHPTFISMHLLPQVDATSSCAQHQHQHRHNCRLCFHTSSTPLPP
jgi:hypothetical protein